ncbi:hypothetical protein E9549_20545 [Blastococcus sp. MG754426]|uniref:hypothetical protein n=1 Tax=unclassified Blastococcus TaxID=2619396 RepID=UPI001EF14591|nr:MULTISPECIES: hypothetical protein [unclassified Blastococcus]MCF6509762.1 hypothetical protein [Blastococcus sp. MG754426]MCF6514159.1 hypothetical protein [Blastococcus sp. MG754427]
MANGTGILSAGTVSAATPEVARRTWPRWLALGLAMIAVAVVAVVWDTGARLLLGAVGLFLAARGSVLLRGARSGAVPDEVAGRARSLGTAAVVAGAAGLAVAVASASLSSTVLLVGVPLLLLGTSLGLLGRGGPARRGGQALLVWSVLVTGLLVVTGLFQSWDRAADVATVVAALAVAVLGVPLLIGAANLRSVAAAPAPAPAGQGCGGCACGAGGCGA